MTQRFKHNNSNSGQQKNLSQSAVNIINNSGNSIIWAVVWLLIGILITLFLVIDPLGISPIDNWLEKSKNKSSTTIHGEEKVTLKHGKKQLWTCGMHPQVIQDHPGNCPICGMKLVPLRGLKETKEASIKTKKKKKGRKILFYRNPMDPTITSPVPRKDEMGMDYVPVYSDEVGSASAPAQSENQGAVVVIDPTVQQNMNVVVKKVIRRNISRQIRTVGYLDYDQEKIVSVTTKYSGFIEKTYVNYTGQPVKKGDPLFEIYSPKLVQTEQELLSAKRYADRMAKVSGDPAKRAKSFLEAAKQRLMYWDITREQIENLEKTGKVFRTLTVFSPASGVVIKRMEGLEGMASKPGMKLLEIADISDLWLSVEIFTDQLPWIRKGSKAKISLTYFPGKTFIGRIRYIEPEVSEKTRTVRLTFAVPNPHHKLRVGMYATILMEPVVAKNALVIPLEAVFRTGERNVVVVALGDGKFAPREIELGPEGDGFVQVLKGLSNGDRIVTSAQFLIDSESNLKEAIQKMIQAKLSENKGVDNAK